MSQVFSVEALREVGVVVCVLLTFACVGSDDADESDATDAGDNFRQVPHSHETHRRRTGTEFRFERPYRFLTPGTGLLVDSNRAFAPFESLGGPCPDALADPRSELDRFLVPRFPAESDMAAAHAVLTTAW